VERIRQGIKHKFMQITFVKGLVKASGPLLITFGLFSFIVLGVYATDYYYQLNLLRFSSFSALVLAIAIALIVEGGRFAFLLASVRDFSTGNKKNGWLGLLASIFLVIHDITVSWKISQLWSERNATAYFECLLFLVLFGLFVEIRLVMAFNQTRLNAGSGQAQEDRVSITGSSRAGAAAS